ncbi:glycosyl transferase family protein [Oceanibacterium hippocampi]|uniref:Glycosyl transferase family 3 N-terminal domain-containing protein n=1 Tax=Oceanibacterium hippocampi TaxID=745714 RepID=A0A1Y5U1I6_9PROT|nr:glycosyl transferase family protein [Oceanibacterium hippocampi]SLN76297.1 hypothetical protein OCH7691_04094 [Oceanibacterium hippocampi]
MSDHPFAAYVRALGRGPKLYRNLDQEEACEAMTLLLAGEATPEQVGAFLLLLRRNGETAAELAGMVEAARSRMAQPEGRVNGLLDWPSYADRHRQQPWFLLAARLVAGTGQKVLVHGIAGHEEGLAPTRPGLDILGIPRAVSLADAAARLAVEDIVYLALEDFAPEIDRLFDYRRLFGVRTAVNTFARDLNPLRATYQVQGVFHPPYVSLHLGIAERLEQPVAAIFKGVGGEVQWNVPKPCRVTLRRDGAAEEVTFPALAPGRDHVWREEDLAPSHLAELWQGTRRMPVPEAAVIGTAAIALLACGRASTAEAAIDAASALWEGRDRQP